MHLVFNVQKKIVFQSKDEVFSRFLEWKAMVERTSGRQLKVLRSDNGGEYTSVEFEEYLKLGVQHELTVPKTPQQNGVAERLNRIQERQQTKSLQVVQAYASNPGRSDGFHWVTHSSRNTCSSQLQKSME